MHIKRLRNCGEQKRGATYDVWREGDPAAACWCAYKFEMQEFDAAG